RRREAERPAPPRPAQNDARDGVGMAEQLGRMDGIAVAQQLADRARGHGLPAQAKRRQHARRESVPGAELAEERRRAARIVAEGVVETHDDLTGAENAREDLLDEGLGLHA